jgi:hypothetical protein
VALPRGAVLAKITTATTASAKAYSSVQTSKDDHIELNSDLVYVNHSCDPSLVFDMHKMEVRVVEEKDLKEGDALTFFYPSSEWDMAQPFDCFCGAPNCKGWIEGAKTMARRDLEGYWLNQHIKALLADRFDESCSSENSAEFIAYDEKKMLEQDQQDRELGKTHTATANDNAGIGKNKIPSGGSSIGMTNRELSGEMGGDTSAAGPQSGRRGSGVTSRELSGEMGGDTTNGFALHNIRGE